MCINYYNSFVKEKRPRASVHNVESLKYFMYLQAKGVRGIYGTDACGETVRNYWNIFIGAWKRKNGLIASNLVESIINVKSPGKML